MPLKRGCSIPFVIMAGSLLLCWLLPGRIHLTAKAGARLPPPDASVPGGLCDAPFSLKLTAAAEGASIRYTLDGTEPTLTNGDVYLAPLRISSTTLLRAAEFEGRARVSAITTHSYLFFDEILRQPKEPPGFPSGSRAWNGMPSVYQMDARSLPVAAGGVAGVRAR